jgi:hypothetical protein
MPPITLPTLAPWHFVLVVALLCLVSYWLATVQRGRAQEDWANAYFYAPSQKTRHRQRRQRWQDISRALLAATVLCLAVASGLYFWRPAPAPATPPVESPPAAPVPEVTVTPR